MAETDSGVRQTDDPVSPGQPHSLVGPGAVQAVELLAVLTPGDSEPLLLLLTGGADLLRQHVVRQLVLLSGDPALGTADLGQELHLPPSIHVDHLDCGQLRS